MIPYLTNIRTGLFGQDNPCPPSRIILEATEPVKYITNKQNREVQITLPGSLLNIPPANLKVFDGQITTIEVRENADQTPTISINLIDEASCSISELPGQPFRLLVDIDRSSICNYFNNQRILLDPARDKKNKGPASPTGLPEHIPMLDIAKRLAELLTQVSADVCLTRNDPSYIPPTKRLQMASEFKATIFLSLAAKVEKRKPRSGFLVKYYYGQPESQLLATIINDELVRKLSIPSRGVTTTNITILRENPVPAAIIETACISHRLDEGLLRDIDFRQLVAQCIFNGLATYLRKTL